MRWPLVGAQVKQRNWSLLPFFLNLKNYIALKAKLAVTSAKVPIYTHTCVCLAYISFADLQSVEAPTHHQVLSKHTFPLLVCIP
jgi:hypothetical protein